MDRNDVALFICEREKVSWSDLESRFVRGVPVKKGDFTCPKCGSDDIGGLKSYQLTCKKCGFLLTYPSQIARQTLLNYVNASIKDGIVEKTIDEKTYRPVYRVTTAGKEKLGDIKVRKELHEVIDKVTPEELAEIQNEINKLVKKIGK